MKVMPGRVKCIEIFWRRPKAAKAIKRPKNDFDRDFRALEGALASRPINAKLFPVKSWNRKVTSVLTSEVGRGRRPQNSREARKLRAKPAKSRPKAEIIIVRPEAEPLGEPAGVAGWSFF